MSLRNLFFRFVTVALAVTAISLHEVYRLGKYCLRFIVILLTISGFYPNASGQKQNDVVAGIPVNYDEAKTGSYTLPDPLLFPDGKKVKNAKQWYKSRRPQIISLFEEFQYGKMPAAPKDISFDIFDKGHLRSTALR